MPHRLVRNGRMVLILATLVAVNSAIAASPPRSAPPEFSAEQKASLAAQLDREWRKLEPVAPNYSTRDLFALPLSAVVAGWHPERVERMLALAREVQDLDPKSPTCGNFKWYRNSEKVVDKNAVEFSMQKAALLRLFFRDRLSAAAAKQLDELIDGAVAGIRSHKVNVSYTNIFLMKIWNCIALGEATGRADLAAEGYAQLDEWLAFAARNGVTEYLSPTYYAVDLESLGLIARFAARPEGRAKAEAALRYCWTDIGANWFAPAARLGGAHSRDYDYATGHGMLDAWVIRAGWAGASMTLPANANTDAFAEFAWWQPPAGVRRDAGVAVPRFVFQHWGEKPGQWAAQYVGEHFSLGSAGANYHNMDKVLAANFAGGRDMPTMFFFMDGRNDAYGRNKLLEGGSGHMKSLHLRPFVAAVQRGPEVLQLAVMDMDRRDVGHPKDAVTTLISQVVLPAEADVWMGEARVKLPANGRQPLPAGAALFVRVGDATVGLRFVAGLKPDGSPAPVELVNDGPKDHAMRLSCVHSEGVPAGRSIAALWVRGAEGLNDEAFAAFRREFTKAAAVVNRDGDTLDVVARAQQGPLRLRADVAKGTLLSAEGFEPGIEATLLSVNGRDLGREILGAYAGPAPVAPPPPARPAARDPKKTQKVKS